jgi:hypothetical protein
MTEGDEPVAEGEDRFFFIHVMKTAGTTFRQHMDANFPGRYYPDSAMFEKGPPLRQANFMVRPLLARPPEFHASITAYAGHFPFVTAQLLDPELITMTILRHPVSRTVSYLKHCRRYNPQHRDLPFEAIYDDPMTFPMLIHDHQTKVFAITPEDDVESILAVIPIDDRRLAIAKDHLRQVDLLGFSEEYDAFTAQVIERFGWRIGPKGRWWESTEDWQVPDALIARIEQDNQADIEFYEFARDLARRDGSLPR